MPDSPNPYEAPSSELAPSAVPVLNRGPYREYPKVAPVSLTFGTLVIVVWIASLFFPSLIGGLWLSPPAVFAGEIWRLVTYAGVHPPGGFLLPLFIAASIPYLGWYVEPALGRSRTAALIVLSALSGAVGYMLVEHVAPLVGGLPVFLGYFSAFVVWSIRNRAALPAGVRISWYAAPLVALYFLASFLLAAMFASLVGVLFGLSGRPAA